MFLELRDQHRTHCITEIWLKDGYLPQIDGEGPGQDFQLEPAVWFKVLLLETVRINCQQQVVRWVTYAPSDHSKHTAGSCTREIYGPGSCYDYDDDQDNLFDIAEKLLDRDSATKEYKQDLFRLLHCYVLPVIRLTPDDLPLIENMLEMQMCLLNGADNELQRQFQITDGTKRIMKEHRSDFARKVVNQEISLKEYSKEFLEDVKRGLEDDIAIVREKLNDVQKKVNQAKEDLKNLKCDGRYLERMRGTRDNIKTHLELLLKGMAEIKNFLEMRKKKLGGRTSRWMRRAPHIESTFQSGQEQLGEQRQQQKTLLDKKLLLVSVKEALRLAIGDLHEDKDTVGLETSVTGGGRATDVLASSTWSTLGERVSKIVHTSGDPIAEEHQAFCKWVVSLCRAGSAEEELRNLNVSFQHSTDLSLSMHEARLNSCSSSDEEFVIISDLDIDPNENCVRKLKTAIHKHFRKITKHIAERELKPNDVHFVRKVWLYYETCFFSETMDAIASLYELAYEEEVQQLCTALERLHISDMEVRDSWILSLFPEMVHAEESSETESAGDLTSPNSGNTSGEDTDKQSGKDSPPELVHPTKISPLRPEASQADRDSPLSSGSNNNEENSTTTCTRSEGSQVEEADGSRNDKTLSLTDVVPEENETVISPHISQQIHRPPSYEYRISYVSLDPSVNEEVEEAMEVTQNSIETMVTPGEGEEEERPDCEGRTVSLASIHEIDVEMGKDLEDAGDKAVAMAPANGSEGAEAVAMVPANGSEWDEAVAMVTANRSEEYHRKGISHQCRTPLSESGCESDLDPVRVRLTFQGTSTPNHDVSQDSGFGASSALGNHGDGNHGDATDDGLRSKEKLFDLPLVTDQREENTTPKSVIDASTPNGFRQRTGALDQKDVVPPKRSKTAVFTDTETIPRKDSDETLELLELVHTRADRKAKRRRSTHFDDPITTISEVLRETTPLRKLQALSKSLREINDRVGQLRTEQGEDSHPLGCDDLVTVLMLVLMESHIPTVLSLYTQLRLLEDLMAPFLETGCHGYALVQFQTALQFIRSKV